jgi:hypothetical protein
VSVNPSPEFHNLNLPSPPRDEAGASDAIRYEKQDLTLQPLSSQVKAFFLKSSRRESISLYLISNNNP